MVGGIERLAENKVGALCCTVQHQKSGGTVDAPRLSVIDDCCIPFEDLFRFLVQFIGHFMDLILMTTAGAAHAHSPAHAQDFQQFPTFLAFHDLLIKQLFAGKERFQRITG